MWPTKVHGLLQLRNKDDKDLKKEPDLLRENLLRRFPASLRWICFFVVVSLGKVARERIPGELSPSNYPGRHVARDEYPQRHVARDEYPQRHVAREGVEMSLGIVVNVVVREDTN
ncbi:hypothetical protein Tco_0268336 [Tanacetum coccineum]